jgi:hypothetical protein
MIWHPDIHDQTKITLFFFPCAYNYYVSLEYRRYILMAEPDHIFVKPLPNLAYDNDPAAFPFFYITPAEHEKIIRKYYPKERGPITNVDPIGNSPVIIKKVNPCCSPDTL